MIPAPTNRRLASTVHGWGLGPFPEVFVLRDAFEYHLGERLMISMSQLYWAVTQTPISVVRSDLNVPCGQRLS
jgi:hypothetical protein